MNATTSETEDALLAMRRAAEIARKRAVAYNLKLPIWKDGRVVYLDPKKLAQQDDSANGESAAAPSP